MTAVKKLPADYLALIERFPLMPIKDKNQLRRANLVAVELSKHQNYWSESEEAYFLVLADLIEAFESKLYPRKRLAPRQFLAALLEENELTVSDLEHKGIARRSNLSAFLHGHRGLSRATILRLANYFKVIPNAFRVEL